MEKNEDRAWGADGASSAASARDGLHLWNSKMTLEPLTLRPRMVFEAFMVSCRQRAKVLHATLASLAQSDWDVEPEVVLDDEVEKTAIERIHRTWRRAIEKAAAATASLVVLFEDDLVFGRWFGHNLLAWPLLEQIAPQYGFYASLYDPGRPYTVSRPSERYRVVLPMEAWGAQALVMSPATAQYISAHWDEQDGNPDIRMPRLASHVTPIYYHAPSLVDHAEVPTTWGGSVHRAADFDPEWRASTG